MQFMASEEQKPFFFKGRVTGIDIFDRHGSREGPCWEVEKW